MTSEVFAPAKVNLTLHVTGQRQDGYHLIDSIVAFADVGDRLWITPAPKTSIKVTGPFAQGVPVDAGNLVWAAMQLAGKTAHIAIEKNLPHGGGIGGGSSDAAAILRHYGVRERAASLGADVPVCLAASAQRMRGIGNDLCLMSSLPPVYAVLVNPGIHVATADVFKALQIRDNPPMPQDIPAFETSVGFIEWLRQQRNDLKPAAIVIAPEIAGVLAQMEQCRQIALARMSGSGSTCFGLCQSREDAVASEILLAERHPDWWIRACRLS
ncbi:4-(cytidine 5'-diphospho)-2-C-methyl-D-erythritol kinase [Sulfitobacter sp. F26204]|uniref:4-(cytidine 5'-diphospho)-2-C-methyl-D-erythritol kinase n=1 Tax=Sulfitobacter sp. F26204 TaxID=2996014 RepID=UPI00225E1AC5|nr:4-(cytidine 5'-diphospho)-2-C-methyl-D-erythritol kinase [Sulfitobacter sp. F26204]MCX7558810.1 4-(cytidine 5'-diphospho)-2-C-methyl-D-erythritol kinase [Sulfitobacter sp. F26204]